MASITAKQGRTLGRTLTCVAVAVATACGGNKSAPAAGTSAQLPNPLGASTEVVNEVQRDVSGLTPTQTAHGMGGILYYAQKTMQPGDFTKVASAFPGSDALINEGTKLGMPSEMYGLTSLRGTLKNAGISPEQFNQIVPAMTGIISKKSGAEVAQKFAGVFK
jgi:hypothetical protein